MRRWLWTICAASLLVFSSAAGAADSGTATDNNKGQIPPVAQTLVREGDFSIKLAAVLDLGTPSTEEEAEDLLVSAGIVPLNGWLSDYPVTPEIIGQLQESVSRAASQGTVPMTSDQAVKGLYAIAAQFDLPTPAGGDQTTSNAPAGPQAQEDQQNLDTYYSDAGPPIVTYYPPPPDYLYLYNWVPYPVWWFGFWFPGFYISTSFSAVVVYHSVPVRVSNHIIDRDTGIAATVDPDWHRGHRGGRPRTILRTEEGERYRTFADMRNGISMAGSSRREGIGRTHGPAVAVQPPHHWSPEARRSAGAIYSRSMPSARTGHRFAEEPGGHQNNFNRSREQQRGIAGGTFTRQYSGGERHVQAPPLHRQYQRGHHAPPSLMREHDRHMDMRQAEGNRRSAGNYRRIEPTPPQGLSHTPPAVSGHWEEHRSTGAWSASGGGWHGRSGRNDRFTGGCRGRC